jgi:hypothetical protein
VHDACLLATEEFAKKKGGFPKQGNRLCRVVRLRRTTLRSTRKPIESRYFVLAMMPSVVVNCVLYVSFVFAPA